MVDSLKDGLGVEAPPSPINAERKEVNPENSYMTPFEEAFLAGSKSIKIKDEEIFVNSRNILALMQDPDKRKVLLTPHCVTDKKENPEKAIERRGKIGFLANLTLQNFFESERLDKYSFQNIKLFYKPGKSDDALQLNELEISFSKNGAIINLSEIADDDLVVSKDFKHVADFLGKEGNALKFKVKSEDEIKKEVEKKEAIRVLIVEDEEVVSSLLYETLEDKAKIEGLYTSAQQAIELLNNKKDDDPKIDLLITDLGLFGDKPGDKPGGTRVVEAFRKKYPDASIVVLTGDRHKLDELYTPEQQKELNFETWGKPFRPANLIQKINKLKTAPEAQNI